MRLSPKEYLLAALRGDFPEESMHYMPREQALTELKELTGVDFGYDCDLWEKWLKRERKRKHRRE